jgi:hypothetical protein
MRKRRRAADAGENVLSSTQLKMIADELENSNYGSEVDV